MADTTKKRTRAKKTMPLTAAERMGRTEDFGEGSNEPATEEDLARSARNQALREEEARRAQEQADMQAALAKMSPEELMEREIALMQQAKDGGDPNVAQIMAAIAEDPYVKEARDIRERLAELEKNEPALQDALDKLEGERDEIEAKEQERASSPLALTLEVVECEFATTHYPDVQTRQTIPTYAFGEQTCIYGKEHPDQDCRTCVHHRIAKYGHGAPMDQRRYFNHGWVIPIPSDEAAEALGLFLRASGLMNLRNIDMEIAYIRKLIAESVRQRESLIQVQQRRTQGAR